MDPSFLAALPDDIRREVLQNQLGIRPPARAPPTASPAPPVVANPGLTEVSPEFLAALPPAIQEEVGVAIMWAGLWIGCGLWAGLREGCGLSIGLEGKCGLFGVWPSGVCPHGGVAFLGVSPWGCGLFGVCPHRDMVSQGVPSLGCVRLGVWLLWGTSL